METKVTFNQGAGNVNEAARYDAACRRVLSNRTILAHIMKACMGEYKDYTIDEIAQDCIEGQPQTCAIPVMPDDEDIIQGPSMKDRTLSNGFRTYDVCFRATVPNSCEKLTIIIKLAALRNIKSSVPLLKQALLYSNCFLESSLYSTTFKNGNPEKIYFILVCTNPYGGKTNFITNYSLASKDVMGDASEPDGYRDLLSIILVNLSGPGGGNYSGLIRLLDILLSGETSEAKMREILQNDFGIPLTQTLNEDISAMCSSRAALMEAGIARSIAEIKRRS